MEKKTKEKNTGEKQVTGREATQFKPGQSGNPNGRKKGILNLKTRVLMAVETLSEKYIREHNAKKENKAKQIGPEDVDLIGDIFMQIVNKARAGNERYIFYLVDQLYGKAKQTNEHTGPDGGPIEVDLIARRNKLMAFQKRWEGKGTKK